MKRAWSVAIVALVVVMLSSIGLVVGWRARRALKNASNSVDAERELRFEIRQLGAAIDTGFEWVSAPATFRSADVFQGHLYIASSAGLFEYDERGNLLRDFRVGRDLPPSPLTQITQGVIAGSNDRELIIGTETEGVLMFDGHRFRQLRPASADAREINAVLPLRSGQLLLGTSKRGVLVFDGTKIEPFHSTLNDLHVTSMSGDESELWVGTLDRGAIHWHAGQAESFGEAEGLPDVAVHSIAMRGSTAYLGTSVGVAEIKDGKIARVLGKGMFARALYADAQRVIVGTIDEGLAEIALEITRLRAPGRTALNDLNNVQQIFATGDAVYAVAPGGVYKRSNDAVPWKRVLREDPSLLADRNISAIAGDKIGQVWIGYFDRGLDVVTADGRRARHVEDEHVYCVNRIVMDASGREVDVATANGLALFDDVGREQRVLGKSDGLMAEHVTDVVLRGEEKVIATPAGLTFVDAGGARSLYAFHGLVNNHVYALAYDGKHIVAGTLGGISLMNDDQILTNLTTASSGLKHNWVTAVVPVDGDWFLGTYGAGVMRMTAEGKIEAMEVATTATEVNPNAMLTTKDHVLAGTLGNGLYVYDRRRERWSTVTSGLPSMNVTALAEIGGYIYVGTENGLVRIAEARLQ
jgi:ligand-binding sensor domain-containing protein